MRRAEALALRADVPFADVSELAQGLTLWLDAALSHAYAHGPVAGRDAEMRDFAGLLVLREQFERDVARAGDERALGQGEEAADIDEALRLRLQKTPDLPYARAVRTLELNAEEERHLRELWRERHYTSLEITPNNLQQVMLPEGSEPLRNDWGTAPGCVLRAEGVMVIMLPGPPREIRPMLEHRVRPILASLSDGVIASHTIHFFGIGESEMEYKLRGYMNSLTNPTLAPYAKNAECLVRVTASAPGPDEAEAMMAPVIERVRGLFGDLAYGMDTPGLAEFTTKLMLEKGVTLATAESCTGGELAKSVTDVPGASAALKGGVVVYTNEAKARLLGVPAGLIEEKGAVSYEVAVELARRVRELMGSDFGVGITGLAGPDGDGVHEVGTVFVSLADKDRVWVREKQLARRGRAQVRLYACQHAFDMLRRRIQGLDMEAAADI